VPCPNRAVNSVVASSELDALDGAQGLGAREVMQDQGADGEGAGKAGQIGSDDTACAGVFRLLKVLTLSATP
jgi:hypothetical protein